MADFITNGKLMAVIVTIFQDERNQVIHLSLWIRLVSFTLYGSVNCHIGQKSFTD